MTDYEEPIRTFQLDVPEHFNFAREVIGKWAQDPDKLGMWWLAHDGRERKVTFREFAERSDKFAEILQKSGVKAGDRVLVQLPRIPQWWEVLLGCMKAGAVAVPGTVLLTPKDILYRSALSEGVAYVCDPDNAAKVDQVRSELPHLRELFVVGEPAERDGWRSYDREVDAASGHYQLVDTRSSDPCLVYFTSGTVGNPKMVLHTHASYPIGHEGTGPLIRNGYGQPETILLCCNFPPPEVKPGSMGKPSPTVDVAVIDEEGNKLPYDGEGDIAVRVKPERPVGLFKEYWRNPEASAACMRGDWYVTGDRAYVDGDGYFWFVGRADDVIISAGYRIGPFEVESALVEQPAVAEAAVVASPDEMRGEIVKAFVILAPGYTASPKLASELQEHVKKVTAPYKYPREVEFVESLPKTISGKIRRIELREMERQKKLGK